VGQAFLDELAEFVRIPSVSADPAHDEDVRTAGEWVCELVRRAGGQAELVPTDGKPLAIGEIPASTGRENAPTVLLYGHFDVQPPPPLELWESGPFELTPRDGWLYGRGIADDKGQLYMLLKAAESLAAERALPVNIRIACDGEEEIGGHSVVDFIAADERGADACVVFDSIMLRRGLPTFSIATRGLVYFHVRLRTGEHDLHSGLYGGAALNAVHALMQCLSALLPRHGRLPEPLRAGVLEPAAEETAAWAKLQAGGEVLAEQGAHAADAMAAEEFWFRVGAEPSLDVNGIQSGSPVLQKTVIPVEAEANLSIRLAPGQKVDMIATEVERLLREAAPVGAELEVERLSASPAGVVTPDEPAIRIGLDVFERVVGTRPLLVRLGGTLPIVPALVEKGIPTIVTGFALPESNVHSPNERLPAEYLPLGIETARELYTAFAALG
jgi:acetylornithine deacetylase/succinyl-diaminopimelate desuccinylase-like protein